jgi:hypothetical protein
MAAKASAKQILYIAPSQSKWDHCQKWPGDHSVSWITMLIENQASPGYQRPIPRPHRREPRHPGRTHHRRPSTPRTDADHSLGYSLDDPRRQRQLRRGRSESLNLHIAQPLEVRRVVRHAQACYAPHRRHACIPAPYSRYVSKFDIFAYPLVATSCWGLGSCCESALSALSTDTSVEVAATRGRVEGCGETRRGATPG